MARFKDLYLKFWAPEPKPYKIIMTNATRAMCGVPYSDETNKVFLGIKITFFAGLLFMGLIGNVAGIIFSRSTSHSTMTNTDSGGNANHTHTIMKGDNSRSVKRKRINTNSYLLTTFYTINLLNTFLLGIGPLMTLVTSCSCSMLWRSRAWIIYIAKIHNPVSRTFIAYSYICSVLYFLNQMVAIAYPFKYRVWISKARINMILVFFLLYVTAWHAPVTIWYEVHKIYTCQSIPWLTLTNKNLSQSEQLYESNSDLRRGNYTEKVIGAKNLCPIHEPYFYALVMADFSKKDPLMTNVWNIYQISREMLVNILPFMGILVAKLRILRSIKSRINPQSSLPSVLEYFNTNIPINPDIQRPHTSSTDVQLSSLDKKDKNKNEIPKKKVNPSTSNHGIVEEPRNYKMNKLAENKQHKKTLYVLTAEFGILLLPLALLQICTDHTTLVASPTFIDLMYDFSLFLQTIYVTCTFYINLTFNRSYRSYVLRSLKANFTSVKDRLKNGCNKF